VEPDMTRKGRISLDKAVRMIMKRTGKTRAQATEDLKEKIASGALPAFAYDLRTGKDLGPLPPAGFMSDEDYSQHMNALAGRLDAALKGETMDDAIKALAAMLGFAIKELDAQERKDAIDTIMRFIEKGAEAISVHSQH
jgi:hypothetical protein